jgi:hypothetical protein
VARKPSRPSTRRASKGSGGKPRSRPAPTPRRGTVKPVETAYQRRIRQYLEAHPGATRREARGHRPAEHATREQRARERGKLTERERAAVKRFAIRNARRRPGSDPDEIYADLIDWTSARGFETFDRLRSQVNDLAKNPSRVRVRLNRKTGQAEIVGDLNARSRNMGLMESFVSRHDVPDIEWLFYH